MAALTNMLVLSAIVASMSFPTTNIEEVEIHPEMPKKPTINETQAAQPLTVDSKPPFVWFVKDNNTNSIEEKGTTKEIYTIMADDNKENQNIPVLDLEDNKIRENKNHENITFITFEKKEENNEKNYYESTRLSPEKRPIAITEDLAFTLMKPKYNFPETNKATEVKENISPKSNNLENIIPFLKHQNIYAYAVGPALYPQSIYRREFSVPFFE